jgi:Protein of unknown function (DUF1153)
VRMIVQATGPVIVGPFGTRLTRESLPPPSVMRWTNRRKAEIVAAVTAGLLTIGEACSSYAISAEEYASWHSSVSRFGCKGLMVKHLRLPP